jgi:hypothetical protein
MHITKRQLLSHAAKTCTRGLSPRSPVVSKIPLPSEGSLARKCRKKKGIKQERVAPSKSLANALVNAKSYAVAFSCKRPFGEQRVRVSTKQWPMLLDPVSRKINHAALHGESLPASSTDHHQIIVLGTKGTPYSCSADVSRGFVHALVS